MCFGCVFEIGEVILFKWGRDMSWRTRVRETNNDIKAGTQKILGFFLKNLESKEFIPFPLRRILILFSESDKEA
jgi:hypothetical protein